MNLSIWKNFPTKLSPASRHSSSAFAKRQSGTEILLAGRFCSDSPKCCEQPEKSGSKQEAIERAENVRILASITSEQSKFAATHNQNHDFNQSAMALSFIYNFGGSFLSPLGRGLPKRSLKTRRRRCYRSTTARRRRVV